MSDISIRDFYKELFYKNIGQLDNILENDGSNEFGHFNVFDTKKFYFSGRSKPAMSYNRRLYYKISLIKGNNLVEFAGKSVKIEKQGILFATPRIPYRYTPKGSEQAGHFCVFTRDFVPRSKTGFHIDELPIFQPGSDFVFQLSDEEYQKIEAIFLKMDAELSSDYFYKYDLIRNYLLELIHTGQKLKPLKSVTNTYNASDRISFLFIELLERQFPIESNSQSVQLKTPKEFSDRLGIHTNHLNKVLKESTGKSTTEIINGRFIEEAGILLKQTKLNVSEIAFALGFEEVAHFSNFFKKQTGMSPMQFRN